jgi:hypothetical protein
MWRLQIRRFFSSLVKMSTRYISIDVECAAIGKSHLGSDRYPCSVAMVESGSSEIWHRLVTVPDMISPLTKFTGMTASALQTQGMPLQSVLDELHSRLSPDVVLIGCHIDSDIEWMQLKQGVHYRMASDLSAVFKTFNPRYSNFSYFPLSKLVFALLSPSESRGFQQGPEGHNPVIDAKLSLLIYERFVLTEKVENAKSTLNSFLFRKKFPKVNPTTPEEIDGVCPYGFNPDKCICGEPTLRDS